MLYSKKDKRRSNQQDDRCLAGGGALFIDLLA
jgi:hypothetical protein